MCVCVCVSCNEMLKKVYLSAAAALCALLLLLSEASNVDDDDDDDVASLPTLLLPAVVRH